MALQLAGLVGLVEVVEGFAPAQDPLAFDELCGLVGAFAGLLAAGEPFTGPLVFDVDDGQLQQLDDGGADGTLAA